jgi:hypothetical protein
VPDDRATTLVGTVDPASTALVLIGLMPRLGTVTTVDEVLAALAAADVTTGAAAGPPAG